MSEQETQQSLTNRATRLEILTFKKYRDLETGVRVAEGHWKCHHSIQRMLSYRRTSYQCSTVTMALFNVVSEIFNVEKCRDLEIRVTQRSLKVTESGTIR